MIQVYIDTSHNIGSLALHSAGDFWLERRWSKPSSHSELATAELQQACSQVGIHVHDISQVIVNVGPGSFTGIRVGLNIARTLAYTLNIPIAGVSTFAVLAAKYAPPSQRSARLALHALRDQYYIADLLRGDNGWEFSSSAYSSSLDKLSLSHSDTPLWVEGATRGFHSQTFAEDLHRFWRQNLELRTFTKWIQVVPLYIRGSEAEEKLRKGLF